MPLKVIVIGGGVAGTSATHELVERGFAFEVFDKHRLNVSGRKGISAIANFPESFSDIKSAKKTPYIDTGLTSEEN